jgi:AcrR family transcriptional regulator
MHSAVTDKQLAALPTHERLIAAATRVFARSGLEGATTREIAREAAVNEVTLFRHFRTKEKLIAAVLHSTFDEQDAALAAPREAVASSATLCTNADLGPLTPPADLRASLLELASRYEEVLRTNMPLVRTLIGEIHRYGEHEGRVMRSIFAPLKAELLGTIEAAARAGQMRAGVDPVVAADLFGGMIFYEVLRRSGPAAPEYSTQKFHAACVDVFVRGIERVP